MERTHTFKSNRYLTDLSIIVINKGITLGEFFDIHTYEGILGIEYYYTMYDTRNVNKASSRSQKIIKQIITMIPQFTYVKNLPKDAILIKKSIATHGTNQ
jgi:hypothetical protein